MSNKLTYLTLEQLESSYTGYSLENNNIYNEEKNKIVTINNLNNLVNLSIFTESSLEDYAVVSERSYKILKSKLKKFNDQKLELSNIEKKVVDLLREAIDVSASDVHFVRNSESCEIKFRVNGYIDIYEVIPSEECDYLMFVLYNVMAATKDTTWNRKTPQDANILLSIKSKDYRFRYSHMPIFGEGGFNYHSVIRIIYPSTNDLTCICYEDFGYNQCDTNIIRTILNKSQGLFIVSGTTGSGKSTSLKKYIEALYHEKYNRKGVFITVEDPVEYLISGTQQSSVLASGKNSENPFTLAVKSAMRRDPDVLMIGEIRDSSTADALSNAVESGHYCLSTIHAGSVLSVVQRLIGLGMKLDKIISPGFLAGITCQKLVPRLCEFCKVTTIDNDFQIEIFHANDKGCKSCNNTGFSGRVLLIECLVPNIEDLKLISNQDWVGLYNSYREKRIQNTVTVGLGEGFTIKDKAYLNVLSGNVCINFLKLHFGEITPLDKEILHNVYKKGIST